MIPSEGHIYYIRVLLTLELLDLLGSEIAVVLGGIDLKALTPYVDICVHFPKSRQVLFSD